MFFIVCLDDNNGMMFNFRRQSRDRVVIKDIVNSTNGRKIFIDEYSKSLFCGYDDRVEVCKENSFSAAQKGDFCFVENLSLKPYLNQIEGLFVYRWNRIYPADFKLDIDLQNEGFKLVCKEDMEGFSHKKITKEIYKR